MDKARRTALAGAAALVIALVIAPAASALDEVNTNPLRKAVTVNAILRHERALQAIANANLGTRRVGHRRLRPVGRLRQAPARAGVLQGQRAVVRVLVLPGDLARRSSRRVSPEPRPFTTTSSRR
jgi:hypothetical protein